MVRKYPSPTESSSDFLASNPASNAGADAFGRQRVSNPTTLFDYQSEYDVGSLFWDTTLTGAATQTHNPNDSSVDLTVTTAAGDKAVRQSYEYIRYQPGKSQLVMMTFTANEAKTNLNQKIGLFDNNDGVYLEIADGGNVYFVRRKNASGTSVEQASWNLYKFGATYPYLSTLDLTKAQIVVFDLEWLGVGSVRCGFVIDGQIIWAHQFTHASEAVSTYMRSANLPVRYEIENKAATASSSTLECICSCVMSEGGFVSDRGIPFSAGNGVTTISVTTRRPVLSIRPKATFNSITNRGTILPKNVQAYCGSGGALIEVVYNGSLTGAAFTSANANSITEYDITATAISGGITIDSFYVPASGSGGNAVPAAAERSLASRLPLTLNAAGTTPIPLSVVATSLSGTASTVAALNWQELR